MKLYADAPARRARQVAGDLVVLLWLYLCLTTGQAVRDATLALAVPGRQVADAGEGLARRLRDAGEAVGDLPLVGERAQQPFEQAGGAADRLAAAGDAQAAAVADLALWLALAVGVLPALLALAVYLPVRWRFVREATVGRRLVDREDVDLFALRALARQPLHRLARVSEDPAGDWRRRDAEVVRRLAALELDRAGLRAPADGRAGRAGR